MQPLRGHSEAKIFLDNLIVGALAGGRTPGGNTLAAGTLILHTGTVAVSVRVATGVG